MKLTCTLQTMKIIYKSLFQCLHFWYISEFCPHSDGNRIHCRLTEELANTHGRSNRLNITKLQWYLFLAGTQCFIAITAFTQNATEQSSS
jgi:hypothetical protein